MEKSHNISLKDVIKNRFSFLIFGGFGILILTLSIIILSMSLFYSFVAYSPAANTLCEQCHSMKIFKEGLRLTPHGQLNCYTCHTLTAQGVANEIIVYLTQNPSSTQIIDKYSPKINMYRECTSCHVLSEVTEREIHKVHISIVSEVESCDICHNPHSPHQLDTQCTKCHSLQKTYETHLKFHEIAISELYKGNDAICAECHSSQARWEIKLSPDSLIGLLRGYKCFDCHQPPPSPPNILGRSCLECHKT